MMRTFHGPLTLADSPRISGAEFAGIATTILRNISSAPDVLVLANTLSGGQVPKLTDVQQVESSPPDDDRVVDRIFTMAQRYPEHIIFFWKW